MYAIRSMKFNNSNRQPNAIRRRGMATLETVLSMPFLLALAAMIIAVGSASVRKNQTAIDARHNAWAQRAQSTVEPFRPKDLGLTSLSETANEDVRLPFKLATVSANSRNALLTGPWDDAQAGFEGQNKFALPHTKPLKQIAIGAVEGKFSKLTNLFSNPAKLLTSAVDSQLADSGLEGGQDSTAEMVKAAAESAANGLPVSDIASDLVGQFGGGFGGGGSSMSEMSEAIESASEAIEGVQEIIEPIKDAIETINDLTGGLSEALNEKDEEGNFLADAVDAVGDAVTGGLKLIGEAAGKAIKGVGEEIGGPLGEQLQNVGEAVEVTTGLLDDIKNGVEALENVLQNSGDVAGNLLAALNGAPGNDGLSEADLKKLQDGMKIFEKLEKALKAIGL